MRSQSIFKKIKTSWAANRSLLILLVVSIGLLLVVGWWLFNLKSSPDNNQDAINQATSTVEQLSRYPQVYQQADLPRYPKGEVTHFGTEPLNTAEPIVIYVSTKDNIQVVKDYYHNLLLANHWSLDLGRSADSSGVVTRVYTKASQDYHLTLTADSQNQQTSIIISWQSS